MASVAESSEASIPVSELARIRQQILEMPDVRSVAKMHLSGATTSTNNSTEDAFGERVATIPESTNAYHTPNSSPNARRPLSKSKSATVVEMEAMVNPSPSQEAFKALTRASSFHGYPGGDTQPMESQVYRNFAETVAKSATTTPKKGVQPMSPSWKADTYDTLATDKTPKTCIEGDTGYIDLGDVLPSPSAQTVSSSINDIITSPREYFPNGDHFATDAIVPKTPAIAGHKRNRSGEIVTSETTGRKHPAFSQLFGGCQNGAVLSTTQLFNQTQAPSSPVPDGPRSDPIVTRPSPNLLNQFSLSSPTLARSSPVATTRPMTAGEPRDRYMSVQESQERRAARLRSDLNLYSDIDDVLLNEQDQCEVEDVELRRYNNKRVLRTKSEQALQQFEKVRAASRLGSRSASSPAHGATIDLTTPATTKKGDPIEFDISEDGNNTNKDEIVELENTGEPQQSDDEYDEYEERVIRSQRCHAEDDEQVEIRVDEIDMEDEQDDRREGEDAPSNTGQQHRPRDRYGARESLLVSQHSAVADSQPTRQAQCHSLLSKHGNEPSSLSSIVPGSQYAGTISQSGASRVAYAPTVRSQAPSSPPFPVASSAMEFTANGALADPDVEDTDLLVEPVIPESDLPEPYAHETGSSRPVNIESRPQSNSNDINVFSTARSHLSALEVQQRKQSLKASPQKALASQQSNAASQSPLKAAGVRHFADIAASQSLSRGESRETDDGLDGFMAGLITAEDQQYFEAISSPPQSRPQKRPRLIQYTSSSVASSPARKSDGQQDTEALSSPLKKRPQKPPKLVRYTSSTIASPSPKKDDRVDLPPAQPVNAGVAQNLPYCPSTDVAEQHADETRTLRSTNALQESPSKANEMPTSTPESVVEREKAGAKAVSQLLSTRSTKASRSEPENEQERPRKSLTKIKYKAANKRTSSLPAKQKSDGRAQISVQSETGLEVAREASPGLTGDAGLTDPENNGALVLAAEEQAPTVLAPSRVFALFKGTFNSYYTATWLSSSADGLTYRVRFDDTTETDIEVHHVRPLDIRVGDLVKVDQPRMRNNPWVVKRLGSVASSDAQRAAGSDIYGRIALQVQPKPAANSFYTSKVVAEEGCESISVPVSTVYLTRTLWKQFRERVFTPPATSLTMASRLATPSSSAQTETAEMPTSRSKRAAMPTAKAARGRTSLLHEEPVPLATTPTGVGMFSGMVFALSFGNNDADKEDVARSIRRNGGIIIESGFDELFDLPYLDSSVGTSPSKTSPRRSKKEQGGYDGLQLKPEYQATGFVALITDRHSRRLKYLQALALDLPTLSGKWITDCLDISKNQTLSSTEAEPLPWLRYLLPAGESVYLGGAVRSRTLSPYSAKEAKLVNTISNRARLLNGDGVIVVAGKKGKANWELSETYAFLTLALGAGRLRRVADLEAAKTMTTNEPDLWKWVHVDDSVAEASLALFGKGSAGGRKRKRGEDNVKTSVSNLSAGDGRVKVVNNEFVVQSLILGALVD